MRIFEIFDRKSSNEMELTNWLWWDSIHVIHISIFSGAAAAAAAALSTAHWFRVILVNFEFQNDKFRFVNQR